MAEPNTDTPPVREPSEVLYLPPDQVPGTQGQQARGEVLKSPLAPFTPAESAARYGKESEALAGREEEEFRRYQKTTAPLYSELEAADRSPRPAVPHLANVGPPPDQRQYQKYAMGYMAAMSVVMAFSGRLAGRSGAESLSAFAGAAEGWQTGNQQAYENGFKQWEASNKRILQQNENQLKEYDLILKDRSLKREDIVDRLKIASIKHYDDQMYNALQKGNLELAYKLRDMQWEATFGEKGLKAALGPYREGQAKHNAEMVDRSNKYAEMEENGWVDPRTGQPYINSNTMQPYTDTEKAAAKRLLERVPPGSTVDAEGNIKYPGAGKGTGIVDPSSVRRTAELMYDGKLAPPNAMTMRTPFGQQLSAELERLEQERGKPFDPGAYYGTTAAARAGAGPGSQLTPAEARALAAALKDMEGQRAAIHTFEQTAVANGEVLLQLARKVDTTGVPAVERWIRGGMRAIAGDPDVSAFDAQLTLYKTEMARIIMNPNLKGVLTVDARHEIDEFMNKGATLKQLQRLVPLLKADADRRTGKIDEEINSLKSRLRTGAGPPPIGSSGAAPGGGDAGADPLRLEGAP